MIRALGVATATVLICVTGCTTSQSSHQRSSAGSDSGVSSESTGSAVLDQLNLLRQGQVLLQQNRPDEALAVFQKADRLAPGNATVHNMIGMCHLQKERFDQALVAFNRALELVPAFTDARNNRGATYLALEQYRMAEVDFLAVLSDSTYPHRTEAYYNLGMAYFRSDQLSAAEENLRRAVSAKLPVFEAYLQLAELFRQRGENVVAEDLYEEARIKFPDRHEATLELARMMLAEGRDDEARPLLEELAHSDPNSEVGKTASGLLESSL